MRLRGIEFGPCLDSSGLRGFGDGYWFHKLPILGKAWYDFRGSTFVAKSTTLHPTKGNMALTAYSSPKHLFPDCIWVDLGRNMALNAVGLSGPGASTAFAEIFERQHYSGTGPFMISVVPEGTDKETRVESSKKLMLLLKPYTQWKLNWGLQINISCPNSNVDPTVLTSEALEYLEIAAELGVPLIIKVNLLVPWNVLETIMSHQACNALCLTNTIPFGQMPDRIPWRKWFPKGSPLARYGGGGLSGAPLLPLLHEQVKKIRSSGYETPLIVGGGITSKRDVDYLMTAGLRPGIDSMALASIAMLRPRNIRSTIKQIHLRLG